MIRVWTDGESAGLLDRAATSDAQSRLGRQGEGTVFNYIPDASSDRAVSLTMPVRLESYVTGYGLAPIFEMNLPEGALREQLRARFARHVGRFDDLELLTIVGRSQIGRVRFTGEDDELDVQVPFHKVDDILAMRRGGNLFRELVEQFASFSGLSGVQPKVLIRDEGASAVLAGSTDRKTTTVRSATHIVKFWVADEFPELAANEYFCLLAAQRSGLRVPQFRLAEDGRALVIDRFDLLPDGRFLGFEDFCVLNARRTSEKYRGSYETAVMKRFETYSNSRFLLEDLESLFQLIALNCALRNGDAHLKNFGVLYHEVLGEARLAPVYDLITTNVYPSLDGKLALTLNGSTRWPDAASLMKLGETRAHLTPSRSRQVLERVADGMSKAAGELRAYVPDHPDFTDIGTRMLAEWEAGIAHSLRG